ncbi:hypothetical protein [Bifidobacterium sp. ESL0745]|uniref:hypothetical protein n=1 Tax=Bifidobacterium sp. ESL0745 TaxID=2983226 RepID=UPI0023F887B1|nr:hypothetical protein [Bifidobacterium sp. ESL0745]MDF7665716.1 hypothetical protein [Bifidobacterium sp. ESL0745]
MTDNKLCPICENMPHDGTLCKTHRKVLADNLHNLRIDYYQIQQYAYRKAKPNNGGGARSPYPQAAYALSWGDLMDEVGGVLRPIGADVGVWEPRTPQLIRKLINRVGRIAACPECGGAYRAVAHISSKVRGMITPVDDEIIYGRCLNPDCGSEVAGARDVSEVECRACGSVWSTDELRRTRREKLHEKPLEATPAEAAKWIHKNTGLYVTRKVVNMWIQRDSLTHESLGNGRHRFDMGELLALAESMRHAGAD